MRRAVIHFTGFVFTWAVSVGGAMGADLKDPAHVVVVANAALSESVELARYYMNARSIPGANLVTLECSTEEVITRGEYVNEIRNPLRRKLMEGGWLHGPSSSSSGDHSISFLVICQGLPLKIKQSSKSLESPPGETPRQFQTDRAAVDSELALLPDTDYTVSGLVRNPFFNRVDDSLTQGSRAIRVTRLDGPTPEAARKLVDRALEAENSGLRGRAYIDIGGPHKHGDRWLEKVGNDLERMGFETARNRSVKRFHEGDRFDKPAFYFGWYTRDVDGPFLVPGFQFPPGAVGYHIHSASAGTLRSDKKFWAGPLIDRGITATVGNVYEPYLECTHIPQMMVAGMQAGMNWGEASHFALPVLSWQSITIGDPLYEPFKTGLSAQLERGPDLTDDGQQYAIIRFINLLEKGSRQEEALVLGRKWFDEQPGVALGLRLYQLAKSMEAEDVGNEIINILAQVETYSIDEYGMALDVVELLHENGRSTEAIDLLQSLLVHPGLPTGVERAMLSKGQAIAQSLGRTTQYLKWLERWENLE